MVAIAASHVGGIASVTTRLAGDDEGEPSPEELLWEACIHEAGHVLTAWDCGLTVEGACAKSDGTGLTRVFGAANVPPTKRLEVAYGGIAAEEAVLGTALGFGLPDDDRDFADRAVADGLDVGETEVSVSIRIRAALDGRVGELTAIAEALQSKADAFVSGDELREAHGSVA